VWVEQVISEAVSGVTVRFSKPSPVVPDLIGGIEYRMAITILASGDGLRQAEERILGLSPEVPPELRLMFFYVKPSRGLLIAAYGAMCD
jgi:hypothetical protein